MFLAQQLGMTVDRLREDMSGMEFLRWSVYFDRKAQRKQMEEMKGGSG